MNSADLTGHRPLVVPNCLADEKKDVSIPLRSDHSPPINIAQTPGNNSLPTETHKQACHILLFTKKISSLCLPCALRPVLPAKRLMGITSLWSMTFWRYWRAR